jgi:hypothetical protein
MMLGGAMVLAMAGTAGAEPAAEAGHKGYEMPPYRVERSDGAREIRSYGPHLLAEVTVTGDRSGAAGTGFRMLAGYIFGRNAEGAKIAMTVPVAQVPVGERDARTWTMTFMMPADWPRDRLPAPDDARIRFVDDPGGRQVVERFSGWPGEDDLWSRSEALRAWAAAQGLRVRGGPRFYFYDAPMTLPWRRRNEVAFAVK